eukprot:g3743.t1
MLRAWSSVVGRTRGEMIPEYRDVFGLPERYSQKTRFFTIAHDDATRRKHSQKLPNQFTSVDNPDGTTSLRYDPLPYQQTKSGPKIAKKNKDRKKSCEEFEFLLETIGFLYGKEAVAEMLNDAKEFDAERWKEGKVRVCNVMVDQASWEMVAWQVGNDLIHLIFAEAEAHRDSNSAEPKSAIMYRIAKALRSFMRGPKGKRANLGVMRDTRLRMLARARDPTKPPPKWKYMQEAMREAEEFGGPSDLISILEFSLPLQSSVDKRWFRTRYVALFLRKYKWRLALILSNMSVDDLDAPQNAGVVRETDEAHLDLGDLSSDEEEDSKVTGDHVYFLKVLEPVLHNSMPIDAAIAFSEVSHDRYAMLQTFSQQPLGKVMGKELAKRATIWWGKQYDQFSLTPSTKEINTRRAVMRWAQNRKIIANCCVVGGKYGKYGIREMMDGLRKHVNFAVFQAADPQFGYWETRVYNQSPRFPIDHQGQFPMKHHVENLSFKPGALAKSMAELHDLRLGKQMQEVVAGSLACRPLNENEAEKPHKERFSNNDRRCKLEGTNYSMQRDRLREGLNHDRYTPPDLCPKEYSTPIDAVETAIEEASHGNIEYLQSHVRSKQPETGAELRTAMRWWKSCIAGHHTVADLPEYIGLKNRFKTAASSRNADGLGKRGAEFICRLEYPTGTLPFDVARAVSRRLAEEQAIQFRLAEEHQVLLQSPQADGSVYQVIHNDEGLLQMLFLERKSKLELQEPMGIDAVYMVEDDESDPAAFFVYPPEDRTKVKCGLLVQYDAFVSAAQLTSSQARKSLVFKLADEVGNDFDDSVSAIFTTLSTPHRLAVLNTYIKKGAPQVSAADYESLSPEKQVLLYNLVRENPEKTQAYLQTIKKSRDLEVGQISEKLAGLKEKAAKKRKTDKDVPGLEYEMKDSPRKNRDEGGGRQSAAFTADVYHNKEQIAEIRSHRVEGGEKSRRLKFTWLGNAPETCSRTMSRKWMSNSDPMVVVKQFLPYVMDELLCGESEIEIRVTKETEGASSASGYTLRVETQSEELFCSAVVLVDMNPPRKTPAGPPSC